MNDRIRQYLQGSQAEVITAAETKLERPLSADEKAGIENMHSGLRLESLYMAFSHVSTTHAEVVDVLAQYAAKLPGPTPPQAADTQ